MNPMYVLNNTEVTRFSMFHYRQPETVFVPQIFVPENGQSFQKEFPSAQSGP